MMASYALDHPCSAQDYDCAGNITAYDDYTKNDYVVDGHRDEGHTREGYYDDDYVYAS